MLKHCFVGSIVCVSALLLAVPAGAQGQDVSAESLVRDLMAVWESGDASRLADLFHEDAIYVDKPNERQFDGLDEIIGYVEHVHSWAGEVEIEVAEVRGGLSFALAEWVMKGVQSRPIPGMVPVTTDRAFTIHGLTMIDVRDGRPTRAVDYIQVVPLMLQLGARIELPGGVVLGGDSASGSRHSPLGPTGPC